MTLPVEEYETIYIGYPMWWYAFPMIIYTLFDPYDFSGDGGTYGTIRKLAPERYHFGRPSVEMKQAEKGDAQRIGKWMKNIGQIWKQFKGAQHGWLL